MNQEVDRHERHKGRQTKQAAYIKDKTLDIQEGAEEDRQTRETH